MDIKFEARKIANRRPNRVEVISTVVKENDVEVLDDESIEETGNSIEIKEPSGDSRLDFLLGAGNNKTSQDSKLEHMLKEEEEVKYDFDYKSPLTERHPELSKGKLIARQNIPSSLQVQELSSPAKSKCTDCLGDSKVKKDWIFIGAGVLMLLIILFLIFKNKK